MTTEAISWQVTENPSNSWEFMHQADDATTDTNPLSFGWVTGQNKLDPNKHAAGTETLSLLANPGETVAAALAVTVASEQIESPGGGERAEPPWPEA